MTQRHLEVRSRGGVRLPRSAPTQHAARARRTTTAAALVAKPRGPRYLWAVAKGSETKVCATCGRGFQWRRAWATVWDSVRYCSARCRSRKPSRIDQQLEEAIIEIAASRGRNRSLCPSEAAQAVRASSWRPLMERTRQAARRLAHTGKIEVLQKGRVIDPCTAKGPIRLRITRPTDNGSVQPA